MLKPYLPSDAYQHFLLLFCAITLCSSEQYKSGIELAHNLLIHFVEYYGDIYGEEYITSSAHNSFIAYPFESKLYQIKMVIRSGSGLWHRQPRENKSWKTETKQFPVLK